MKATVIYHRADFDGIFCREIAKHFMPDAELVGWDYGDPKLPFPSEDSVYVLDLSPECFTEIPKYQERLIWIDHHKSAIEKFPSVWPGYRIDGVAACRLAWQWFTRPAIDDGASPRLPTDVQFKNREVSEPLAVRLAGEYDIWDKRDPRADLFQHGLRSCDLTDDIWCSMLANPDCIEREDSAVKFLLENGKAIQYAKTQENKDIITSYGFDIIFEGVTFLACNHARYNSHLFTAGIKPHHEALFGFKWDGDQWQISLYHIDGKASVDLSLIAVKFGGGGHKGACGFRVKSLPFLT